MKHEGEYKVQGETLFAGVFQSYVLLAQAAPH